MNPKSKTWMALAAAAYSFLCGCVNLYTRSPFTDVRIERVYQSSRETAAMSIIVMFPQMMSDSPSADGFMPENLLTIPLGCLCLCDAACETAIDTVLLPVDWPLTVSRQKKTNDDM